MDCNRPRIFLFVCLLPIFAAASAFAQPVQRGTSHTDMASQGPDIATYMQIGKAYPAGYTWDGETVFFRSRMTGAYQVYRLDKTGWPYQLTTFEDGVDFFSLSWGGDMAIVGASTGGSEQSQLFLMDTPTGRLEQLTNSSDIRYGSVQWATDDRSIYYRSNEENGKDFHIYRMAVATGESEKIFGDSTDLNGWKTISDLSQDGSRLIISRYNSNFDKDIFLLNLADGSYQQLNQDSADIRYDNATLMPDNKTVWLICNGDDDGIRKLARMKVGSPIVEYVNDGWLDPRWEVENIGFSRDYKYMRALVNEEGYLRLKLRETESKAELPSPPLDGLIGGGYFDRNGACLVSFQGPTRTLDIWRWQPKTEELVQLTFSTYAGVDREQFVKPELIHFKSFDDLEIPAFLYLPPDHNPDQPVPFVVYAHGGPESQFKPAFVSSFQYLLLHGYGVLAVNPRGSSGYGTAYISLDNYHGRKDCLKDYRAGVEWLIDNGYTEPGMIGIRGRSYGGYVVLGMITEYPDLFSAAIDVVGIANFETFLTNTKAYRRHIREAEYGPLSDPDFLAEISPIHKAHLIRTPLLVIHGENDSRVPVGEARQIIKAINDNGGVVDSLIFPDEGHVTAKLANTITQYRRMVAFFDSYLKGSNKADLAE